ncbi:Mitogen-activated protein kinase [Spironucleus salmonicida]|uniref:Mitogen-activated protein kinase n=1 Tax=Spironucleus salmonicida TaxID=348837 RepID=V6LV44_9EUKA|nr:Mitogen-activated protein kinase [Spironucleus salmonicida]|eukprot:EST48507.1 Kinase, CMGC MAPK [Spironucleus salmonicida]
MSKDPEVEKHVLKRYELIHKVGKGAYGIVWKAKNRKTGELVALKKIFQAFQNEQDAQRTYREVMFLNLFSHENIIKLQNVMKAENGMDLYLVFDFMESDLHHVIQAGMLQDAHKQYIFYQILKSMKYLHSGALLHRDLKPSNCLINSACTIKIADFGLARSLQEEDGQAGQKPVYTDYVATRWYRPPELLLGSPAYDKPVDIWALGCILGEMISGRPLFPGSSATNQIDLVLQVTGKPTKDDIDSLKSPYAASMLEQIPQPKQRNLKEIFPKATSEALDLIQGMLHFNPQQRLTIEQALNHPYVAQFRQEETETTANIFKIPVSDNIKLSVEEYKQKLYADILERKKHSKEKQEE